MDQKRFLAFIVLSMTILIGWSQFVVPLLPKPAKPNPAAQNAPADEVEPGAFGDAKLARGKPDAADDNADADPDATAVARPAIADQPAEAAAGEPVAQPPDAGKPADDNLPKFPDRTVVLGSVDPKSEFRQLATLTSRGGAVEKIELNDPRYTTLRPAPPPLPQQPHPPLSVVGTDDVRPFTLALRIPQIDAVADLSRLNWQVIDVQPAEAPHSEATFRVEVDGLEITRHYKLATVDAKTEHPEAPAYELQVDLTFKNLKAKSRTINYELQGPTGVPLENEDNTQKFRDVVVGFVAAPGAVKLLAGKAIAKGQVEEWTKAFDYIGVDVQYFAALLAPVANQLETPYTRSVIQERLGANLDERSEISVLLTSVDLDLEPAHDPEGKEALTHSYRLFAGPKRDDILPPGASQVIEYGWFHFVSRPMLALLKGFHNVTGSWGIAIICLTIVVRSVLFPLSIKQARGAAKMQELQPKIAELKEKYGKDKEKMARAQMELFSQHKYNPLAGCLPVFLQLPIFMGLYSALNHSVDLRMAKFLWIENLAAPDALAQLPFVVPFFGWKVFNLLPLITIALFIVQQKMFMPPPTSDEQAMQQKMMNYMMIFMGVMFYKVPAGLCVYFIASSLWGMAERKLLPKARAGTSPPTPPLGGSSGNDRPGPGGKRKPPDAGDGNGNGNGNGKEGGGLFAMLLKAADKETSARKAQQGKRK
ncbi:MAG: membrane protein insertase YidC [Planctomycetaceae bacterium]|nr:membrane protein insertase YidC [Planctomycetaceae bacterium]